MYPVGFALESESKSPQYPPMLMQYLEYKEKYPDCLLFFQVGDFYELFFEDAKTVAKVINLTLTSRDKNSPNPVPMCGVPVAVIDAYAERLIASGHSVAIVKQTEAPTGKGMVQRALDRIITPGVRVLGAADADASDAIVIAVQITGQSDVAIAFTNVQSGKIEVREGCSLESICSEVARLSPTEVILPKLVAGKPLDRRTAWVRGLESVVKHGNVKFRSDSNAQKNSRPSLTEAVGYKSLSPTGKRAVHFLVSYVDETTVGAEIRFSTVQTKSYESTVSIDATTRQNLELVRNSKDASTRGTLFEYLHTTVSPGGARLLREWILHPLLDLAAIEMRQGIVESFVSNDSLRLQLRSILERAPDIERIAARIELGIVTPRELGALRDVLLSVPELQLLLTPTPAAAVCESIDTTSIKNLSETLHQQLVDAPPLSTADGGIMRPGFSSDLDALIEVSEKGKEWILELEQREREVTGISSLKIKYTSVFGYFIEITNSNLSRVPSNYIRKQTTANSERFITDELKVREEEVLGAGDRRIALEKSLFDALRRELIPSIESLRIVAYALSTLDVLAAFAEKALSEDLVKPHVAKHSGLKIDMGRHPQLSEQLRNSFIPNSLLLEHEGVRCCILTGPNMGGKSTYLRQVALIVVLAQIGSFVPARKADIGIVDRIFARLGASDDIAEGESTFMVEMREASHIIGNATQDSLLLIDEIGRGTATSDGLAIARAILEWIVINTKSRTLFATHFHELTALASLYPLTVRNISVASVEKDGHVLFTHQIKEGPASKSYGIEVARLAGLPKPLLVRAREILGELDKEKPQDMKDVRQLTIFDTPLEAVPTGDQELLSELKNRIDAIDVNSTTPLEALTILSELKHKLLQ